MIVLTIILSPVGVWAEESDTGQDEVVNAEASATSCGDLKEKMDIILEVYQKVSTEFSSVSDKVLCTSTSEQCEYFYSTVRQTQKEYRKLCAPDYEMAKIEKCDYSENPCTKNRFRTRPGSYARSSPSVKDNPFGVKILTLFTGD
ncbi:MAG: hypothetical protein HY541_04880 [Deltaproteobacteria bacterium]|nr:hypothetical protein [Deltaproteobacteria bacterium]